MGEKFFQTEVGQKILLFLAPFFLSPHEFRNTTGYQGSLKKHLHLSSFAPLLGAVFLTGAVVAVFRTLNGKGLSISWMLNYQSARLIFLQAGLLTWLGYSAAFSRTALGYLMKFIRPTQSNFQWPLAFWLSYYGGVLIVWGVFSWIFVGALSIDFSYVTGAIALILLVFIGLYLRLEIKLAQEKHRHRIYYIDWSTYNQLSLVLFVFLQALGGFLLFYRFPNLLS